MPLLLALLYLSRLLIVDVSSKELRVCSSASRVEIWFAVFTTTMGDPKYGDNFPRKYTGTFLEENV
jgi:hypothetical protein